MNRMTRGLLAGLLGWLAMTAQAIEVEGVKFPDALELRGSKLQLNGAGTRYKAVFKVYAAALYVGQKSQNVDALMKQGGAKRVHLTMLRDIDAEELGRLFIKGIRANTANEDYGRIMASVMRMSQVFTDYKRLKSGEHITLDWLPGTGTVITVAGKVAGEPFIEPEFYVALLRIWLGSDPPDWQLKDALLGVSATQAGVTR